MSEPCITFKELLDLAVPILYTTTVFWDNDTSVTVSPRDYTDFDSGYYEISNGVIAFKYHEIMYVLPYSLSVEAILIKNGFWHQGTTLPFTFDCIILEWQKRWEKVKQMHNEGKL